MYCLQKHSPSCFYTRGGATLSTTNSNKNFLGKISLGPMEIIATALMNVASPCGSLLLVTGLEDAQWASKELFFSFKATQLQQAMLPRALGYRRVTVSELTSDICPLQGSGFFGCPCLHTPHLSQGRELWEPEPSQVWTISWPQIDVSHTTSADGRERMTRVLKNEWICTSSASKTEESMKTHGNFVSHQSRETLMMPWILEELTALFLGDPVQLASESCGHLSQF